MCDESTTLVFGLPDRCHVICDVISTSTDQLVVVLPWRKTTRYTTAVHIIKKVDCRGCLVPECKDLALQHPPDPILVGGLQVCSLHAVQNSRSKTTQLHCTHGSITTLDGRLPPTRGLCSCMDILIYKRLIRLGKSFESTGQCYSMRTATAPN